MNVTPKLSRIPADNSATEKSRSGKASDKSVTTNHITGSPSDKSATPLPSTLSDTSATTNHLSSGTSGDKSETSKSTSIAPSDKSAISNASLKLGHKEAIHVSRFVHNRPGTSVMLEIWCSTPKSKREFLFVNLYKSSKIGRNHAEAYMCRDIDKIVDKTSLRRKELIDQKQNISPLSVNIFLNNSPCNLCAKAIIHLRRDLQSRLDCRSLNFNVYSGHVWKPEINESGLRKLHTSPGVRLVEDFNWLEFYDAFCKWIEFRSFRLEYASPPKTDVEVISRLMDLSKEWGITCVKDLTERAAGDLRAMTNDWNFDHRDNKYQESLNE